MSFHSLTIQRIGLVKFSKAVFCAHLNQDRPSKNGVKKTGSIKIKKKRLRQKQGRAQRNSVPLHKAKRKSINPVCLWNTGRLISSGKILPVFSLFHAALIFWYFFIKEKVQKDKKRAKAKIKRFYHSMLRPHYFPNQDQPFSCSLDF